MAKGKHAAALFEVIHAGKQTSQSDRSGLLRTPKWWFKGRKKEQAAAVPSPVSGPIDDKSLMPLAEAESASSSGASPGVDVQLDPDRQLISFKLTYTSALVSTFAVLVVVVLAYVIGRHMSRGPAAALGGPSTEQIRQGPVQPNVLNLAPRGGAAAPAVDAEPGSASGTNIAAPSPRQVAAPPPAVTTTPGKRTVGLNYVIIQSYPDEAGAVEAVKMLAENGVAATIEKGLRGYTSNWHTVVSADGFARINSREFEGYLKRIDQISDKFAGRKSFKAFKPIGYKWDRP